DSLRQADAAITQLCGPNAPGRARGVAVGATDPGIVPLGGAIVRLKADGSALVYVHSAELGQGTRGAMRKIAADNLAQPLASVTVAEPDTNIAPHDWGTGASRSTVVLGLAVEHACKDIGQQLRDMAAEYL